MPARRLVAVLACAFAALLGTVSPATADTTLPGVGDSPASPVGVDNGSVTRTFGVTTTPGAVVVGATVTVDFQSISGENCAAPGPGTAFDDEIAMGLTAPDGAHTATLVASNTYTYGLAGPQVHVTFDDTATALVGTTAGRLVTTGTFRPVTALSALNGAVASGSWTLTFADTYSWDAKCYYGATLNLVVSTVRPTLPGGPLVDGADGTAYTAAITASAGDAPTAYALASGTLPAGLTLDTTTGAITGTPTTPGASSFGVSATNAGGTSAVATYTIAVRPALPGGELMPGTVGSTYSTVVTADTAGIVEYRLAAASVLPAGLSLSTTTGAITGTPTTPGSSSFRVRARTAGVGWGEFAQYTIGVLPVLPGGALTTGTVGAAYSEPLMADTTGISEFRLGPSASLPAGLSLDSVTGVVSGVPTTPGDDHFRAQARVAGAGWTDLVRYDLGVLPTLPGGDLVDGTAGAAYSEPLIADTTGISEFSLAPASVLPAGLTLDTTTGAITGTPTTLGSVDFRVRARTAGVGWGEYAQYTIGVLPMLPGGALTTGSVGAAYSEPLMADTTGISEFRLGSGASLPAGLTLDTTTGVVSGVPTTPGGNHFRVQARVAGVGWTDLVRYDLGVLPTLPGGALTTGTVGASYTDAVIPDTTAISEFRLGPSATLPAGLTLDTTTGAITGVPTTPGDHHVRVQARVAGVGWTDLVRYDLGVLPVLPGGALTHGAVGASYSAPLIADPVGITRFVLTQDSAPLPAGMALDETTGVVSGTPTRAGGYTFSVRARVGGVGASERVDYVLAVRPTLTSRTLPAGTARRAFSAQLGDPATGIDAFVLAAGSALPPGLSLNPTTGVLSGTPTTAGTYAFAVLATNTAAGTSEPATFTVVLAAPADGLAATGTDVATGALAVLLLLGVGGALVVVRRRSPARG